MMGQYKGVDMKNIGDKIRFTFCEVKCILMESIKPNPDIIMYWERGKELCPICKNTFVRGEHHKFNIIEFWIPFNKKIEDCDIKDIYVLGTSDTAYLLLEKDNIKEALAQSKVFTKLII